MQERVVVGSFKQPFSKFSAIQMHRNAPENKAKPPTRQRRNGHRVKGEDVENGKTYKNFN